MLMNLHRFAPSTFGLLAVAASWMLGSPAQRELQAAEYDVPRISTSKSVQYDYPIVYVRAKRQASAFWANTEPPTKNPPGAELMLLHPDGRREVLVGVAPQESIGDPYVSFDGRSVYFAKYHDVSNPREDGAGADIYRVDVGTRDVVRLTDQTATPNEGAFDAARHELPKHIFNLGPCPLPGGRVVFTSNRNLYRGVQDHDTALQLFVMDDDGKNVEEIGPMNLGGAMHPVVLKDGRIMFSSAETQGIRIAEQWGLWSIHPDGTNWGPLFSGFLGASTSIHFQTQLSNGDIVAEKYYPGATTQGFGTLLRFPLNVPEGNAAFGPGWREDPRNVKRARTDDVKQRYVKFPFSPYGLSIVTEFATGDDVAPNDHRSDQGKVTHPAAAPDNHLLLIWAPPKDPAGSRGDPKDFDSGIYLVKSGGPVREPTDMLLVENDPKYHEMWPRALVSYERIYGIKEPRRIAPLANDGKLSPHLPAGTPYGLVGTSSLYKRESYPQGVVPEGSVTSTSHKPDDRMQMYRELGNVFKSSGSQNWNLQGADAGLYENSDIWGIRIVALEPVTHKGRVHPHYGHASGGAVSIPAAERLRILGEFPVRKFTGDQQPLDPDGNPDTSFLAKIPADVAWTFQTLDNRGMVLNMAQTWHQVRPGEIRNNCGGCHAHSQQPTAFELTAAAKADYKPFDLTAMTPLFTTKNNDESKHKWDAAGQTGLRYADGGAVNVEYHRDVKPIFERSCVACHTNSNGKPAGNLVLDDNTPTRISRLREPVPGTYARLAADEDARFGTPPIGGEWHNVVQASRYIRKMQSRRSLLAWKIFGQRLDGFENDDFPSATAAGDEATLSWHGKPLEPTRNNINIADLDYTGSAMPPPEAVAGKYKSPDGRTIQVAPLSGEDRLTIVRWIDLGCPIDLDYDEEHPDETRYGWLHDDQRPTLTLTLPRSNSKGAIEQILIGMHDYGTGLDAESLTVTADFEVDGAAAGENLAARFKPMGEGTWQWKLSKPLKSLKPGVLTVSIADRQGNVSRIERTIRAD
jgi:hypothetical protein